MHVFELACQVFSLCLISSLFFFFLSLSLRGIVDKAHATRVLKT